MLPLADFQVNLEAYSKEATKQRIDVLMSQQMFWSGLYDNAEQQALPSLDELISKQNTISDLIQSSRIVTQVVSKPENIRRLLDLAFPAEHISDLATHAFDIFLSFPSNSVVMDACFSNEDILRRVFDLLYAYVCTPGQPNIKTNVTFKGKQELISALTSFILTGIKKEERLSVLVDIFDNDKEFFDKWVECIRNPKAQDVFLFFLANYQTRSDNITLKIANLCASHSLMRNFIRKVVNVTLPPKDTVINNVAENSTSTRTVDDRMKEYSSLAIGHQIPSYIELEACSTVLAVVLRCNVPYLCDQIFEHHQLLLSKYLFISTDSTEIAYMGEMLPMLKMCGQVIIHMLRYLVARSATLHFEQFKANKPQLSDEFFEKRGRYFDTVISHFIYSTDEGVKYTSRETSTDDNAQGTVHKYELHPYNLKEIDDFEEKYFPVFINIINTLVEALTFISRCISQDRNTQENAQTTDNERTERTLQVASYLYLLYLSHAVGLVNTSRLIIKMFDNSGDIDDSSSDYSSIRGSLMDETSVSEFMWSDMYADPIFSVERVMNYNYVNSYVTKQIQMLISPFFLYSYIVRSNKISTILRIMQTYNKSSVIQSVGVRIISGIIELGISLSHKTMGLLECVIIRLCSFYLKTKEQNDSSQGNITQDCKKRSVPYDLAIKSIFRETMRLCTQANSMLLLAIKYDDYAVHIDELSNYLSDANKTELVPRTFDEFNNATNIKYPKAYEMLRNHETFTSCVKELLQSTDIIRPWLNNSP